MNAVAQQQVGNTTRGREGEGCGCFFFVYDKKKSQDMIYKYVQREDWRDLLLVARRWSWRMRWRYYWRRSRCRSRCITCKRGRRIEHFAIVKDITECWRNWRNGRLAIECKRGIKRCLERKSVSSDTLARAIRFPILPFAHDKFG